MTIIHHSMTSLVHFAVLVPCLLFGSIADAKDLGKYGQTFAIKEIDIIEHLKGRLHQMEESGEIKQHQQEMAAKVKDSVKRPAPVSGISYTEKEREFTYDPTYIVSENITDHMGKILHYAGKTVNPLDHVPWGSDMLFINGDDESQVKWVADQVNAQNTEGSFTKKIVLVKGSPIELEEKLGINIYFDQSGKLSEQFGIKQVPAIVSQKDKLLQINEIKIGKVE